MEDTTSQKSRKPKTTRGLQAKPGRKRGSTQLHKTLKPEHLEEVHERLIWDSPNSVQAYIAQLGYVDEEEGRPLISVDQLYYYRRKFISARERIGAENVGRFLQEFRIRLDTIAVQEAMMAVQVMRLERDLSLEEEQNITISDTSSNLDLLHQLNRTLYRMKVEAGLIPQPLLPVQRHQIQADVKAQTQVEGKLEHEVFTRDAAKDTIEHFSDFLRTEAVQREKIESLLRDGEPRLAGEIAKAVGRDLAEIEQRLQDMAALGGVKKTKEDKWTRA
jgi:hypothetical protein